MSSGALHSFTRALFGLAWFAVLCFASHSAAFPLPAPTRPTTFPLTRPTRAGVEVVAWGRNNYGQTSVPQGLTSVVEVSAGLYHCLALKLDGTVVAWGDNRFGQLNIPPGVTDVVSISAGGTHNLALKSNGQVVAWGQNDSGESTVPGAAADAVAIAAGAGHSLALRLNGEIVAWGFNPTGAASVPLIWNGRSFAPPSDVVAIAATGGASFALLGDGRLLTWGPFDIVNEGGQMRPTVRIDQLADVANIFRSIGNRLPYFPPLILMRDGTVVPGNQTVLAPPAGVRATSVAGSNTHSLALLEDGSLITWGESQLDVPPALDNVISIAAGEAFSVAVKLRSRPALDIFPTRVGVRMHLEVGLRYQLESATELPNFSPIGDPFIATSETHTQEFVINDTGRYFRIQEVP